MKYYDCYHGTGNVNYQNIQLNGGFTYKPRRNHWLGSGVYFFVDDLEKASWWAKTNRPDKESEPVVLRATLTFEDKELLNLDLEKDLNMLDDFAASLLEALHEYKAKLQSLDDHEWHCKLIDMFVNKNDRYGAIVRTVSTTQRRGPSRFQAQSKQLCVKDMSKINLQTIEKISI